jgi:hypothetical protein
LLAANTDAITVKFNQKTSIIHVTPDTEIWRRGVDLESTAQLVTGDPIFAECQQVAPDGAPIATLIVAAEGEDAVYMEPHHVQEIRTCGGGLTSATRDTVTVKGDDGKVCVMQVRPETVVWRGEIYHDTSALRQGDAITARCIVHYPEETLFADEIWANITSAEGVIVKLLSDRIIVDQGRGDKHSAYRHGRATVVIDDRTHFDGGTRADLKPGRHVRAEGLELGRSKFRASGIHIYDQ